jgi:hypothetical protein
MIQKLYCGIFIMLLFSCQRNEVVYEFLAFRDNSIKMWPDTISSAARNGLENGNVTIQDQDERVWATGEVENGLKTGTWTYHPSDGESLELDWSSYSDLTSGISINYPDGWEIHKSAKRPFQATFPDTSKYKKDKFFIIIPQHKDSIDMDLDSYWKYYTSVAFESEKVKEYSLFRFKTTGGKTFYLSRYILNRNEKEILVFSFLGEMGTIIYDATYSSAYENYTEKHIIFLDMIRSLILTGKRFFSPYDPVLKVENLERPPARPMHKS